MFIKNVLPKIPQYRLARENILRPATPFNLTFSVTNVCQSRCKTCNIWEIYKKHPDKRSEELNLTEITNIFQSLGHIYIFNISGGEPFLRPDFVDIVDAACQNMAPAVIHIPTNALAEKLIISKTKEIIHILKTKSPSTKLTIKPSLDHIDERHDEIRGITGNFEKVMNVFDQLKDLKTEYNNLHVELGTVISQWNVEEIEEIAAFISQLDTDSYRNEIAEQRSEMFNLDDAITPKPEQYKQAIDFFVSHIKQNMRNRRWFNRITNAFRLEYYNLAIRIMETRKQIIPCYAGISNAHLTPYGDIWACCTLGYDKPMGNLREHDYDLHRLWHSPQANEVRAYIKAGKCHCPMANQMYSNILMHIPSLCRVLYYIATSG